MVRHLPQPVANERGERLLAIHDAGDVTASLLERAQVSLVLAHHPHGLMLVRNAHRGHWELPGGYVDPGETAADSAMRELREESGLAGREMVLAGMLDIERPAPEAGLLHCALFRCWVDDDPSATCAEVSDVAFWRPGSAMDPISAIDEALLLEASDDDTRRNRMRTGQATRIDR